MWVLHRIDQLPLNSEVSGQAGGGMPIWHQIQFESSKQFEQLLAQELLFSFLGCEGQFVTKDCRNQWSAGPAILGQHRPIVD